MESSAKTATERVQEVKVRVLGIATLLVLVAVLPAHLITFLLHLRRGAVAAPEVVHAVIFVGGALIMAALTKAPPRLRAGFILGYVLTLGAVGVLLYGAQIVDGGIFAVSTVFAVIYFRWKGLLGVVAMTVLLLSALAVGFVQGWLAPPDPALLDLRDSDNVVRTLVGMLVVSLILGWIVLELMGALDGSIEGLSAAIEGHSSERRARQRTQSVLEQSQRLETIGRLAGGVAHDFNNALVVILGTAQLLERSKITSERQRRLAAAVEAAAWQASEVSKQLLTFSRRDVTRPEAVPIDESLRHMGKVLERLLPEDISIEVDAQADATIWIDASELDQVFFNLAIHSHETMVSGGALKFAARRELNPSAAPPGVIIEVIDDGAGMSPYAVEHAFDPIIALESEEDGRSLGLPLVRDIVEAAGGTVDCASVQGEGTRFRILLPEQLARESSGPHPLPELEGLRGRILVAESSDEVRALLARILRAQGYEVVETSSADAAREGLSRGSFDLICSDSVLDDLPPRSFLEAIAALETPPPLLICSGPISDPDLNDLVASGGATHLSKPFGPDDLTTTVGQLLDAARRRDRA